MTIQQLIQTIKINEQKLFLPSDEEIKAVSMEDLTSILIEYFEEVKQITYRDGDVDKVTDVKRKVKDYLKYES
jgi:hypothetical protein